MSVDCYIHFPAPSGRTLNNLSGYREGIKSFEIIGNKNLTTGFLIVLIVKAVKTRARDLVELPYFFYIIFKKLFLINQNSQKSILEDNLFATHHIRCFFC